MRVLILLSILVSISSCGKNKFRVYPIGPAQYAYEAEEENCTTGKHEFHYVRQMCENLLNNEINNNCALDERERIYIESCEGDFIAY